MRHAVIVLACCLLLAGCFSTPKPFEHNAQDDDAFQPKRDRAEVSVATTANMPARMAERVAAALAVELQSYDIVAAVQPSPARVRLVSLLPEAVKWKLFLKIQAKRSQYLKVGDVVEARIASPSGDIDLGVQRNIIVKDTP